MTRVYLVDDDALVRTGLRMILESADDLQVVGEAADGAVALRVIPETAVDVVLMDLRMPGLSGQEAIAALHDDLPDLPVVVLTTFDIVAEVLTALEAGAAGFLLKDTPPADLIEAVRTAAHGGAVLSPRHTRALLDRYAGSSQPVRRAATRARLTALTEREQQVAQQVALGRSNVQIGAALNCSPATVKAHLTNLYTRLGIDNRVQLAILIHEAGLIDNEPPTR